MPGLLERSIHNRNSSGVASGPAAEKTSRGSGKSETRSKTGRRGGWTLIELLVVLFVASVAMAMVIGLGSSQIRSSRAGAMIRGMHNTVSLVRARAMGLQKHVSLTVVSDLDSDSPLDAGDKAGSGWGNDYQVVTEKTDLGGGNIRYDMFYVYRDKDKTSGEKYYNIAIENDTEDSIWFGPRGFAKIKKSTGDYEFVSDCKIIFSGYGFGVSSSDPIVMEVSPLGKLKYGASK